MGLSPINILEREHVSKFLLYVKGSVLIFLEVKFLYKKKTKTISFSSNNVTNMKCTKCGIEFEAETNLASEAEVAERKSQVDFTKAPSPEIGKQYMEMLGDAVPVYKCPKCGFLVVDVADVFVVMSVMERMK